MRSACAAILVAEAEADEKGAGSTPDAMVKVRNTEMDPIGEATGVAG
jgi:hypothetical protein